MSPDIHTGQVWADGEIYDGYVGRWSRLVADELLRRLDVDAGTRWLDVGCGTGMLAEAIRRHDPSARIAGIDRSEAFVASARRRVDGEFVVGDAQELPFPDASFDAAVSGLVLNFVPEPERAAAELVRVVRPGGTVAVYVWDYAGEMQMMRRLFDAAAALDPAAAELDEGRRFPLCRPEPLRELFAATGLSSVDVDAVDVPTVFRDFDDFWTPFLGGQGPAPAYVASLDEEHRVALRERLRADLPAQPDGSIPLRARAWAVIGRR